MANLTHVSSLARGSSETFRHRDTKQRKKLRVWGVGVGGRKFPLLLASLTHPYSQDPAL